MQSEKRVELHCAYIYLIIFLLKQQCSWISQTERQRLFFKCDTFIFMTSAFSEVDYNNSRTGTNVLKRACEMTWDKYFWCLRNWGRNCYRECTRYNNSTTDNTDVIFPSAGQVYPHILVLNQSNNKKLQITLPISLCMWISVTFHLCCIAEHSLLSAKPLESVVKNILLLNWSNELLLSFFSLVFFYSPIWGFMSVMRKCTPCLAVLIVCSVLEMCFHIQTIVTKIFSAQWISEQNWRCILANASEITEFLGKRELDFVTPRKGS